MMFEHIVTGGIFFMAPIASLWLGVIVISAWVLAKHFSGNGELFWLKKKVNLVLFLGSFAFLIGLLGQIIGLFDAFQGIEEAGDISMALIAGGLRVSFIAPIYGFVLFMISLLVWFITTNHLLVTKLN